MLTPARRAVRAVLCDLDGTLLDTVHDLAHAANCMRDELGLAPLDATLIDSFVGNGIAVLVRRSLTASRDGTVADDDLARAVAIYERHYAAVLTRSVTIFPGVVEGLDAMRDMGLRLGCVTNKAERFTLPLLEAVGLLSRFELVLSGDSLPRKKPDPLPLTHAADRFGTTPSRVLLIGDSANDAQAARAAGCPVFLVPYGYNHGHPVEDLDVDAIVPGLAAAADLIENEARAA